jgi:uncharacterized coiled-coil protein SlyX
MTGSDMRQRLDARLGELQEEFARGKARLDQLDEEAGKLRETLLRISGAIQVLTEELQPGASPPSMTQ